MIDSVYTALGAAIRTRREAIGMTQDALAARVGLARTSVTNIERGRQAIMVHQLLRFSDALGIAPVKLLPPVATPAKGAISTPSMPEELRKLLALLEGNGASR